MTIRAPHNLSLRGRLAFLARDSAVYGGAGAISKACALLTFPLLTRQLSVADFGALDFFLTVAGFLTLAFVFGQDSAVARFFYDTEDTGQRRQIISQSLFFQAGCLLLGVPALWLWAESVAPALIGRPDAAWLFRLVLLQVPCLLAINFAQNLLRWTFARNQYLLVSLGFSLAQVTGLAIAVGVFDAGVAGALLVHVVTTGAFAGIGLFCVRQWLALPTDFGQLRRTLPFAVPYGIVCALAAASPAVERALTERVLGSEALGLYAAATKIAMFLGILLSAFQTAWGPFSLALFKDPAAALTYNWVLKLFAVAVCVSVFVLALVADPLLLVLASEKFRDAAPLVFPLAMVLGVQTTSWITEIGIGLAKRSHLNLYGTGAGLAATLLGIVLFAPSLGLLGVAFGALAGQIVRALVCSWLAQRAYPLPWDYRRALVPLAWSLAIGTLACLVDAPAVGNARILLLGTGAVTVMVIGWCFVLTADDRRQLAALLRRSRAASAI